MGMEKEEGSRYFVEYSGLYKQYHLYNMPDKSDFMRAEIDESHELYAEVDLRDYPARESSDFCTYFDLRRKIVRQAETLGIREDELDFSAIDAEDVIFCHGIGSGFHAAALLYKCTETYEDAPAWVWSPRPLEGWKCIPFAVSRPENVTVNMDKYGEFSFFLSDTPLELSIEPDRERPVLLGAENPIVLTIIKGYPDPYDEHAVAEAIKSDDEWNAELCELLCRHAGMDEAWEASDGDTFEDVIRAAADKLGVEVF